MSRHRISGLIMLSLLLLGAMPAWAEESWFADVAPGCAEPLADPWAARFTTDFVGSPSGARLYRMGMGANVGFYSPADASWSLEGRAGIFTRFDFQTSSFDLQTADFIGGLAWRAPLACGGAWEVYGFHHSAHLGGDFMRKQAWPSVNVSREEARVLYRQAWGPWAVYAGPRVMVHADPEWMQGKVGAQGGVEFNQGRWYTGVDLQCRGEYAGDTDGAVMLGFSLSPPTFRYQQLVHVNLQWGHLRAGQLEGGHETLMGLGLTFLDVGPAAH